MHNAQVDGTGLLVAAATADAAVQRERRAHARIHTHTHKQYLFTFWHIRASDAGEESPAAHTFRRRGSRGSQLATAAAHSIVLSARRTFCVVAVTDVCGNPCRLCRRAMPNAYVCAAFAQTYTEGAGGCFECAHLHYIVQSICTLLPAV